jgi:hypothetical protein
LAVGITHISAIPRGPSARRGWPAPYRR